MSLTVQSIPIPVIIDIEVNGFKRKDSDPEFSIVELGAYKPSAEESKRRFSVLIKSDQANSTAKKTAQLIDFKTAWKSFLEWMGSGEKIILSYNLLKEREPKNGEDMLPGDWTKITYQCQRNKLELPKVYLFDLLKLVRELFAFNQMNLQSVRKYLNIPYNEDSHHALPDAETAYKVFVKICGSTPLYKVYEAMAKPGDTVKQVANIIRSYQVVKPIFFDLKTSGPMAPKGERQPLITALEAYVPSFGEKNAYFSEEVTPNKSFEDIFRHFHQFILAKDPVAKNLLISLNNFGAKSVVLKVNCDRIGYVLNENWKYFDIGYLNTTLSGIKVEEDGQLFEMHAIKEGKSTSEKYYLTLKKLMGSEDPSKIYQAMLAYQHPVLEVTKLLKPVSSIQQVVTPIFFHLTFHKNDPKKIVNIEAYQPSQKSNAYFNSAKLKSQFAVKFSKFKDWITNHHLGSVVLCSYEIYKKNLELLKGEVGELPKNWRFFDLSYLVTSLYGKPHSPRLEDPDLETENKEPDHSLPLYKKYQIERRPVTLEDLYRSYDIGEKDFTKNPAKHLSQIFSKMTEGLNAEQIQQAFTNAHPIQMMASLIKTHQCSVSIFWDTETTGLLPNQEEVISAVARGVEYSPRIVEIGAGKIMPNGEKRYFQILIDPECPMPKEAEAVHHISDAMVKGQPNFKQAWGQFIDWCKEDIPASSTLRFFAHNQEFYDKIVALLACRYAGMPLAFPVNSKFFDTWFFARSLHAATPEEKKAKNEKREPFKNSLENIAKVYGIHNESAHRALGDVKTTMQFMERVTKDIPSHQLTALMDGPHPQKNLAEVIRKKTLEEMAAQKEGLKAVSMKTSLIEPLTLSKKRPAEEEVENPRRSKRRRIITE